MVVVTSMESGTEGQREEISEAEKAAHVTLVDVKPFGNFGRLTMMGNEAEAEEAARAVAHAIEELNRNARTDY